MHLSFFLPWQKFIGIIRGYLLWTTANSKRETLIEGLWSKLSERFCHMLHINTYTCAYIHAIVCLHVNTYTPICIYIYGCRYRDYIYIYNTYIYNLLNQRTYDFTFQVKKMVWS
jgi:hypothetical protein